MSSTTPNSVYIIMSISNSQGIRYWSFWMQRPLEFWAPAP